MHKRNAPLRSLDGAFSYDLESLFLRIPDTPDEAGPQYAGFELSLRLHERIHWIQHHGTTIGAFFSLIKLAQEMATLQMLHGISKVEREQLFAARQSGQDPLIAINPRSFALSPSPIQNPSFQKFREFWYSLWWTNTAFYACPEDFLEPPFSRKTFLSAMQILIQMTNSLPYYVSDSGQQRITLRRQPFSSFSFESEAIRTLDLLEGAATVNELLLLKAVARQSSSVSETLKRKTGTETSYSRALRCFSRHAGMEPHEVLDNLEFSSSFLILCDIALNPPLPPLVFSDTLEWENLYPPHRFARLVKSLPVLGAFDNKHSVEDYIRLVSAFAKISSPTDYSVAFNEEHFPNFEEIVEPKDAPDVIFSTMLPIRKVGLDDTLFDAACELLTSVGPYHQYLAWVQSNMWSQRKSMEDSITLPWSSWGTFFLHDGGGLETFFSTSETNPYWAESPLLITGRGEIATTGARFSDAFIWWLALSMTGHYVLNDLVLRVGRPDLEMLPSELGSDSELFRWLEGNLISRLGVSPWPQP